MSTHTRLIPVIRTARFLITALILATVTPASGQTVTLSGRVTTPNGIPLEAQVALSGTFDSVPITTQFVMTDGNGAYAFTVPAGGTYTITPAKDDNPLNGLSTYDLILISRHILDYEPFTSPYQYIAADANNDGVVSFADTIDLRLIITGIFSQLPNNASWRFVPTDYVFPADPLNPPYPGSITLTDVQADAADVDFYGVKVGDLNSTAIISNLATLGGTVRVDADGDCLVEPGEIPLVGWVVEAQGDSGVYTTTVRANGNYYLAVPEGTYEVRLLKPNAVWDICTDTVPNVAVVNGQFNPVDFAAGVAENTPYMTVDLAAPFLRRCFANPYSVQYCNLGPVLATGAYVDVALDSFLLLNSASEPYTGLGGNVFRFQLGDVPPLHCGTITLDVTVSCDAALGQTHCSSAHIFPDTLPYSGPNLEVEATCDGDNVIFTITNTGAPMTEPGCYVVIEDIMVQMTGNCIQLDAGQSETITVPANGSTWRLEIDQPANHPWAEAASAMLEGCGTNGNGTYTTGIVPLFPNDDAEPWLDEDCQANVGSYDPNDKQGFPLGLGPEHFIPKEQEIEYRIRFQNTGTDTAFNVIIRDTLSGQFDLATLRTGGASHPYVANLVGSGVLEFVFANIMLPDSNVNEPASHGYVCFSVKPRAGLPDGTVLANNAAIFFDFNPPIITNTTTHTLGEPLLGVRPIALADGVQLDVFPNPTATTATFRLRSGRLLAGTLHLFDARGRIVGSAPFAGSQGEIDARHLPAGLYFFRLDDHNGKPLAGGRMMVSGQ